MRRFVALLLLLLLSAPSLAQPSAESLFAEANRAMDAQNYPAALEGYRQVLALERTSGALWNAGLAAYFLELGKEAHGYWSELKEHDPEDPAVRAKLVQVYQMLDDARARDAERQELRSLWETAPAESELRAKKEFCRDQFMAAGQRVFVMEQYAFEDPRGVLYTFVSPDDPARKDAWLSLGSYQATNDYMREAGELAAGQRAYHLDGYRSEGDEFQHSTFAFFKGEPPYEGVKTMVVDILEGRVKPISGTSRKGDKTEITLPPP